MVHPESGTGGNAGLDNTQFRKYSSTLGRWMTPDPAGLAAVDPSNPQSWNRYAYVLNNPLSYRDPFGLYCLWDDGTFDDAPEDGGIDMRGCGAAGGTWIDEPSAPDMVDQVNADPLPAPDSGGGGGGGGNTSAANNGQECDNACQLAKAINKTGVQSLGNPCTVAAFYGASALGGAATSGEVYAQGVEAATTYWPQALSQVFNWLYRQSLRGGPIANFILNIPKNYNKAKAAVLGGCNAMQ